MTAQSPLIDRLLALETPKTWSLIATVFGDLAGDSASGKELAGLLTPLGIKPEAMRVALHRLKKDGWVTARKVGREVIYELSPTAREETSAARRDVYRKDAKYPGGVRIVLPPPGAEAPGGPHVVLGSGLLVVPEGAVIGLSLTPDGSVPAFLEADLVPAHLLLQAKALTTLAHAFLAAPQDSVSARILFVHYWRRMALRFGTWAHMALLPEGRMARCHDAVTQVFAVTEPTLSA